MAYIYDLTDTWSAGGTVFNAIKMNVTDSASAVTSKLVSLQTNGTEHFSVTKSGAGYFSGSVGIGITPLANTRISVRTATVTDTAYYADNGVDSGFKVKFASSLTSILNDFGADLVLGTNDTERMRIDAAGAVGIGTASPATKLDVAGAITSRGSTNPYLALNNGTATSYVQVTSGTLDVRVGGANPITFNTNSAERMRIASDGTTTLNVGGVSNTHQFNYNESGGEIQLIDSTGAGPILIDNVSGLARFYKIGTGAMSIGTTGANYLQMITNGTERMRIDASGNVTLGIGGGAKTVLYNDQSIASINTAGSAYTDLKVDGLNLLFRTGSGSTSERMRIDSSGNVGIGGAGTYQLQVRGLGQDTAALTDAGNKGGSLYLQANGVTSGSGGALLFGTTFGNATPFAAIKGLVTDGGTNTVGDLAFSTRNSISDTALTERMRIALNGNVGVGTSSPANQLDVVGIASARSNISTGNSPLVAINTNTGSNTTKYTSLLFQGYDTVGTAKNSGLVQCGPSDANYVTSYMAFQTRSGDALSERMRIDSSGNVGIGTSSPGVKLDILGAGNPTITLRGSDAAYSSILNLQAAGGGTSLINATGGSNALGLYTNTVERIRIDSSGNVGIGCTPGYRLDVAAGDTTAGFGYAMRLRSNATAAAASMQFTNSAVSAQNGVISCTDAGVLTLVGDGGSSEIRFRTNGSERARIDSSGNLLVGQSSGGLVDANSISIGPASPWLGLIDISHATGSSSGNGYMRFGYAGSQIGSISQNGTTAVLYNTSSDVRLKDNITDADDAANLIDALQVRKFDWKADGSHQRYGFVAQELVTVAPEAVSQPADPDDMMGVDYSKLVPMLVKEIQSLRARVAQLEGN